MLIIHWCFRFHTFSIDSVGSFIVCRDAILYMIDCTVRVLTRVNSTRHIGVHEYIHTFISVFGFHIFVGFLFFFNIFENVLLPEVKNVCTVSQIFVLFVLDSISQLPSNEAFCIFQPPQVFLKMEKGCTL